MGVLERDETFGTKHCGELDRASQSAVQNMLVWAKDPPEIKQHEHEITPSAHINYLDVLQLDKRDLQVFLEQEVDPCFRKTERVVQILGMKSQGDIEVKTVPSMEIRSKEMESFSVWQWHRF